MIKIGYVGMGGGKYSAEELRPLIKELGMSLTIVSEWEDADLKWNPDTWLKDVAQFDILICPIDYEKFPYKGNNKLTQCMSLRKPVIASPLQSYVEVIEQGVNGYIAKDQAEWRTYLTLLRDSKELREQIADNAYETVKDRFSVSKATDILLGAFKSVEETMDIIIPEYNNPKYLMATLRSLVKNTHGPFVVHIVSSSSNDDYIDGLYDFLTASKVKHTVKFLPPRTCFSKSVNWALEHSQNQLVCIANNDLLFTPDWDKPLRAFIKENPYAMVQPLSNCDKYWLHTYDLVTKKGVSLEPGIHKLEGFDDQDLYDSKELLVRDEVRPRENLAFYCVLFNRMLLDRIGTLDEDFLNGGEDFDFCYRAKKAGWTLFSNHNSFVFHFGGKTRKVSEDENYSRHHEEDDYNNARLKRKLGSSVLAFYLGAGWEKWDETSIISGIGGSETAAILLAREMAKIGYQVKMFADPHSRHMDSSGDDVEYIPWQEYDKFSKSTFIDFLVCSRTVDPLRCLLHAYKKYVWVHDIWLSNDASYDCCVGQVDAFLCLSDWHKEFFSNHHKVPLEKILVTTNGIDQSRFNVEVERNPSQLIFSSSPDRGLDTLLTCSEFIQKYVPNLKIKVAYGFENWEKSVLWKKDANEIAWMNSVKKQLNLPWVDYLGRVGQKDLAVHQKQSSGWFYPTRFHETNCITAIESGFSGNPILASHLAGLTTTVKDGGILLQGDAYTKEYREKFIEESVKLLTNKDYWNEWSEKARARMNIFTWKAVAIQWHKLFQEGKFERIGA